MNTDHESSSDELEQLKRESAMSEADMDRFEREADASRASTRARLGRDLTEADMNVAKWTDPIGLRVVSDTTRDKEESSLD